MTALLLAAATGGLSDQLTGVLWTVSGTVVAGILVLAGNALVKRLRSRASEPEMWAQLATVMLEVYGGRDKEGVERPGLKRELAETRDEMGTVKRKAAAQGRIITAVVRQAPEGFVPRLNPDDLAEVDEDTIPSHSPWRARP